MFKRFWMTMDEHDGNEGAGGGESGDNSGSEGEGESSGGGEADAGEGGGGSSEDPAVSASGDGSEGDGSGEGSGVEDAYTPNYSFRVLGKEHTFEDWVQPLVTKDTEPKIRELYEKAMGLDHVKQDRDRYRDENQLITEAYERVATRVNEVVEARDSGDITTMLELIGVTEDQMAAHLLERAQYYKLPPEQRKRYDDLDRLRNENRELRRKTQVTESNSERLSLERRNYELDMAIGKPDATEIARAYDAKYGDGSFRKEVIRYAIAEEAMTKKDIAPETAVSAVIERLKPFFTPAAATQGAVNQSTTAEKKTLPVIPKVKGTGKSVAGKSPASLDDLKRIRAEMQAESAQR